MHKKSKRHLLAERLSSHIQLFQCPICKQAIEVANNQRILCTNNHSFDLAKQGYVFLLPKPVQSNYTKELFEARRFIHVQRNFYLTFHQEIAAIIHTYAPVPHTNIHLIDMGTGEGSHLERIADEWETRDTGNLMSIGLDISKEGILQAAKHSDEHIWFVADLAHSPIRSSSMDIVLNILSPSNNGEFARILKNDGHIIKVIPGNQYVQEIRQFFQPEQTAEHSNHFVKRHFSNHFTLLDTKNVYERHTLTKEDRGFLAKMSPLAWDAPRELIQQFIEDGPTMLTIDLDILIGQ